jgi:hypothetical protein
MVGVTAGVLGALALTRLMEKLLFGVSATDSRNFVGVTLFLAQWRLWPAICRRGRRPKSTVGGAEMRMTVKPLTVKTLKR